MKLGWSMPLPGPFRVSGGGGGGGFGLLVLITSVSFCIVYWPIALVIIGLFLLFLLIGLTATSLRVRNEMRKERQR